GAMARVGSDASAFAHRDQRYFVAIIGLWLDANEDAAVHTAWTQSLWQTLRPEGSGAYVNFLENEGADRIREAYPPATYARLAAIKRRYDPENLFRFNQNVPPRPQGRSGEVATSVAAHPSESEDSLHRKRTRRECGPIATDEGIGEPVIDYDTIVVGLGAMGSSAAFHLSRRGERVLWLDAYP